jgi:S1-C subfamily serine protease
MQSREWLATGGNLLSKEINEMSKAMEENNPLHAFSEAMVEAVNKGGAATVLVNARRRFPASGIAYAADLILTADHVVERDEDITVMLPDGSEHGAQVVGRDASTDLALLRLEGRLAALAEAAPQSIRVGQIVLALGRPTPEGVQASLGIISAIGGPLRSWRGGLLERYLRTDAIPYPGFSGGPLVDSLGRVVGINTSGLARGASFAIPVDLAWQVADSLAKHGRVRRGFLGVRSQPVAIPLAQQKALGREQTSGLLLVGVEEGSPAEAAGLLVGDILVGIGNRPLTDPDELLASLVGEVVGKATALQILRAGQLQTVNVIVGERR